MLTFIHRAIFKKHHFWGPSSEAVYTSIVFPRFIHLFWRGRLWQTTGLNGIKFGTLIVDSPLVLLSKFYVCTSSALPPPMGQIWRCIYVSKFWTACQIFKNDVPLNSLAQIKFSASHDASFFFFLGIKKCFLLLLAPDLLQIIFKLRLIQVIM